MRIRLSSIMNTRKKNTGIFIVCVLTFAVLAAGGVFAVQAQTSYESAASYDCSMHIQTRVDSCELPGINTWEDLIDPLQGIGLGFKRITAYPRRDFTPCMASRHLARLTPETSIIINTVDDVHVLLALARVAIRYNSVISWDTCVDDALYASCKYEYWRQGLRELTRPGREKQIIDFAARYTVAELYAMNVLPYRLEMFQELGFFLDR